MAQRIETIVNQNSIVVNVPGQDSIEVSIRNLSAEITRRLTLHGLKQKLGDAAAQTRDPITGASATFEAKWAKTRRVADALIAGDWSVRAEVLAADTITPDRIAAVAAARNQDPETVEAWLEGLDAERRAKVFGHPSVEVELARIRAERKTAQTDPDEDPFEGLDDDAENE